jgi:hypothetical protein
MKKSLFLSALLVLLVSIPISVPATTISYDVQNLGGTVWQYSYTVSNDTLSVPIEEFTIYFENGLYQALWVDSAVSGWTEQVIEPWFPNNSGFYDAIASGAGIGPGETMGGFQVSFEWLTFGAPMPQPFEVYDTGLAFLDSGTTTPSVVPEPGTLMLLCSGLLCLAGIRRKSWA